MRTLTLALAGLLLALAVPGAVADHGEDDIPMSCIPENPEPCQCTHNLRQCAIHPPPVEPCRVGNQWIC